VFIDWDGVGLRLARYGQNCYQITTDFACLGLCPKRRPAGTPDGSKAAATGFEDHLRRHVPGLHEPPSARCFRHDTADVPHRMAKVRDPLGHRHRADHGVVCRWWRQPHFAWPHLPSSRRRFFETVVPEGFFSTQPRQESGELLVLKQTPTRERNLPCVGVPSNLFCIEFSDFKSSNSPSVPPRSSQKPPHKLLRQLTAKLLLDAVLRHPNQFPIRQAED
jgi:hypothetical protein